MMQEIVPWIEFKLTFPDKDLAIRAMVQNEAVTGLQGALSKRVFPCHQSNGHATTSIGNLQNGTERKSNLPVTINEQ